jgi:FkbM family methyltransferase
MDFVKKIVNMLLGVAGVELKRIQPKVSFTGNQQMRKGLHRWKQLNIPVNTVVDVGAAAGTWTLSAKEFWPDASFVLFEPLEERKEELEEVVKKHPRFHFVPFAAGEKKGSVEFVISDDLDGSGIASRDTPLSNIRKMQVRSIPEILQELNLEGPYVVKLDTHGFEVPIIKGCLPFLDRINLFIIECYGFQITDNSLLAWEMCQYMDELGFRLVDVVDVMNRPRDGAFWQCDMFFMRKDDPLFNYNQYK